MNAPLRRNGNLGAFIERSCSNKTRYSDEFDARAAGAIFSRDGHKRLFVYPCTVCRGWHLTKSWQQDQTRKVELL